MIVQYSSYFTAGLTMTLGQEGVNTSDPDQESQWLPEDCGLEWGTCPSRRNKGRKTLEGWRFKKNEGISFCWNQAIGSGPS